MARTQRLTPLAAFEGNIADAESLVSYARAFENRRARAMRRELRERIGGALKLPTRQWDELDCLESDDLFVVFKPNGGSGREQFDDRRPLLRQAVVAACAALETYIADKAMEFVGAALRADPMPTRLRRMPLTIGQWADIENAYERRRWGVRALVEENLRELSSTAPSQIGQVLSVVGIENWAQKVDTRRHVARGKTIEHLEEITERRYRIAHAADGQGQGRANIETEEVEGYIAVIKSVVESIEDVFRSHRL